MKKTLAILLSAVMMLGLLAGCGSKTTEQPSTSGTENTETAALNVGVFYYDYSDVYISSVRSSMDEQPTLISLLGIPISHCSCFHFSMRHHSLVLWT